MCERQTFYIGPKIDQGEEKLKRKSGDMSEVISGKEEIQKARGTGFEGGFLLHQWCDRRDM